MNSKAYLIVIVINNKIFTFYIDWDWPSKLVNMCMTRDDVTDTSHQCASSIFRQDK